MSNVRFLSDYRRPGAPCDFAVYEGSTSGPRAAGVVEMVESEDAAAEAAATLVFDRASVRKAAPGEYIAHGARRDGSDGWEIRFALRRVR
jgi:hypothetical protein